MLDNGKFCKEKARTSKGFLSCSLPRFYTLFYGYELYDFCEREWTLSTFIIAGIPTLISFILIALWFYNLDGCSEDFRDGILVNIPFYFIIYWILQGAILYLYLGLTLTVIQYMILVPAVNFITLIFFYLHRYAEIKSKGKALVNTVAQRNHGFMIGFVMAVFLFMVRVYEAYGVTFF